MRRLLPTLLLIAALAVIPAAIYYTWLSKHAKNLKDMSALDYALHDTTYHDLIFIGASRVKAHVNPRIVDSITGMNSYVLALDGMGIVETNMLLHVYLQHHRAPKFLFISSDYNIFYTDGPLFNVTDYFPYERADTAIRNALTPYKREYCNAWVQRFLMMQKLFATTDMKRLDALAPDYYSARYDEPKPFVYKGFRAEHGTWADVGPDNGGQRIATRENGFSLLKNMIALCRTHHIQPILLYSPQYESAKKNFVNYNDVMRRVHAISDSLQVPFFDYANHPLTKDKKYFYNYAHMNVTGANIFSSDLANDFNTYLRNQRD